MNNILTPNKIIKSKRKSISLIIKNNGEFIVRAPLNSSDNTINKFINEKANWIIKKRTEQISNSIKPLTFDKDETISILGETYFINYKNINRAKIIENILVLPTNNPKEKLIAFLKKIAKTYISKRVQEISNLFNFNYTSISISSAKSCWGSCSFNNRLHFTYKLMLCPKGVVDYIILHELCHTKIKNHSAKFWELIETCNPTYKTYEIWLKKNRAVIEVI